MADFSQFTYAGDDREPSPTFKEPEFSVGGIRALKAMAALERLTLEFLETVSPSDVADLAELLTKGDHVPLKELKLVDTALTSGCLPSLVTSHMQHLALSFGASADDNRADLISTLGQTPKLQTLAVRGLLPLSLGFPVLHHLTVLVLSQRFSVLERLCEDIASTFVQLEILKIKGDVSEKTDSIRHLASLHNLKRIEIEANDKVVTDGIAVLAASPRIREGLEYISCGLNDDVLMELIAFPNLKHIQSTRWCEVPITCRGIEALATAATHSQQKLVSLDLSCCGLKDDACTLISQLAWLEDIRLFENSMTVAGVRVLARPGVLPSLKLIDLTMGGLGESFIRSEEITKLTEQFFAHDCDCKAACPGCAWKSIRQEVFKVGLNLPHDAEPPSLLSGSSYF